MQRPDSYGPSYDTYENDEDGLGDTGELPLLRAPTARSAVSLQDPGVMPVPGGGYEPNMLVAGYEPSMPGGYNDEDGNNIRYGHIPQRVPRRYKTIKKVEPFHGNFVLDSAVPTKLLNLCAMKSEREFTHMRYSAATCHPNDLKDTGFTLR